MDQGVLMSEPREFYLNKAAQGIFSAQLATTKGMAELHPEDYLRTIEHSAYTEAISRAEKAERKLAIAVSQRDTLGHLLEITDNQFKKYDAELEAVEGER